eukprot:2606220-Pleurochrysis_carterae.AAC.1
MLRRANHQSVRPAAHVWRHMLADGDEPDLSPLHHPLEHAQQRRGPRRAVWIHRAEVEADGGGAVGDEGGKDGVGRRVGAAAPIARLPKARAHTVDARQMGARHGLWVGKQVQL